MSDTRLLRGKVIVVMRPEAHRTGALRSHGQNFGLSLKIQLVMGFEQGSAISWHVLKGNLHFHVENRLGWGR